MSQYPGSAPGSAYSASSAGWSANGYDPAMAGGQPSQYPQAAPFQAPQAGYPGATGQPTTSRNGASSWRTLMPPGSVLDGSREKEVSWETTGS